MQRAASGATRRTRTLRAALSRTFRRPIAVDVDRFHGYHDHRVPPSYRTTATAALTYDQLETHHREKIDAYLDILLDWNTRMNLTAIKDRPTAISRHVNDSLAVLPAMDRAAAQLSSPASGLRVVDVGSGAGLPGLIFATLRPEWSVTLLDSLNKRCTFNTAAAEAMGLDNVEILWSRAEDAGTNEATRECFDIATARAVAEVRTLAELCLPLIKVGGYWVAPKGPDPEAEVRDGMRAIDILGGDVDGMRIETIAGTGQDMERTEPGLPPRDGSIDGGNDDGMTTFSDELTEKKPEFTVVTVHKARPTPAGYPRKANAIKKRPL